jgi:starch-binding outer membrane protein, SusD/RagB family
MNNYIKYFTLLVFVSILTTSCYKDEYLNPSQASTETVVTDINGLIALANGLQFKYTIGRASPLYASITASGLSTNELLVYNQGNTDEATLGVGAGSVAGNNAVVTRLWEQSLITIGNADLILKNLTNVKDQGTNSALTCYATLFRGISLLQLGTYWEQAPIGTAVKAAFVPRTQVLAEAIKTLEVGAAAAPSAKFTAGYIGGIDFVNTFNALLARAYNMTGNNDKAIESANKVDLTKRSEYTFDAVTRNPIFDVHYSNVNVCGPSDFNLGLKGDLVPAATDERVLFYLKTKTFVGTSNPGKGFFTANETKIPIYVPGEIMLIKAEALARKNDLTGAVAELNKVLTKATDIYGITAKLPAYTGPNTQAAILREIYRNRCIELYNSGLKLEDSRRFGMPAPGAAGADRNRNFYPYPSSERDNNPNTPADPAV